MKQNKIAKELINNNFELDHLPLTDSVVCKLEVDLIKWLTDLSGREGWKVYANNEFKVDMLKWILMESLCFMETYSKTL